MFGVYGQEAEKVPYIILKTNFFQNAFAGILRWETTMPDEFATLLNYKEKIRTLSPIYIIDGFQFPNGNLICDECISFVAQEKGYNYCPDCDERMPDEPMINEAYL